MSWAAQGSGFRHGGSTQSLAGWLQGSDSDKGLFDQSQVPAVRMDLAGAGRPGK